MIVVGICFFGSGVVVVTGEYGSGVMLVMVEDGSGEVVLMVDGSLVVVMGVDWIRGVWEMKR